MSDFPPAVIRALKKRSRGLCEGCGLAEATQAHHRQYRSRGGLSVLSNALHLCGSGNHTGCHGIAHTTKGEERGWSIRSGYDPELVPVLHTFDNTWTRQPENSDPVRLNPIDAIEYMVSIYAIRLVG